jgi:uncharacterized protein (DUF302 family)
MSYFTSKTVALSMDDAVARVTDELKQQGFGILTDIDIQATLKKKLDVEFRPYRILGACHPPSAHQALLAEPHIGLMLPCNVIVRETAPGQTEVAAVDPVASMQAVGNPSLQAIAGDVRRRLKTAIERL